jgi:preprotein translocase subunit SecY
MSGAMPSILSYSLLLLPASINEFLFNNNESILIDRRMSICFHTCAIILFCYIYNNIIFDPKEISNNLQKNDAIIIGKKSGKETIKYLRYLINRVTFISSIYIIIICIPSEIVAFVLQKPPIIGSTSILIVVNFILEAGLQITAIYLKSSCIKK